MVKNFNQILENLFVPVFEATLDPSSHPYLSKFLNQVLRSNVKKIMCV